MPTEKRRAYWRAAAAKSRQTIDREVPDSGSQKTERVDLGLAILQAVAIPGVCYTQEEIAAFAGCNRGNIYLIEKRALRKLRNRLQFIKDPVLTELVETLTNK
jgi:hypothetical protein